MHRVRRTTSALIAATAGIFSALLVVGPTSPAGASATYTFTVTTKADSTDAHPGNGGCADSSGRCSLRAAIQEADAEPAGSTIDVTVPAGKYTLSLGPLSFTANTIDVTGAGSTATVVKQTKSSAHQLVNVAASATVTLSALELTKGAPVGKTGARSSTLARRLWIRSSSRRTSPPPGRPDHNARASLTLTDSTVTQNSILFPADNKQGGPAGGSSTPAR